MITHSALCDANAFACAAENARDTDTHYRRHYYGFLDDGALPLEYLLRNAKSYQDEGMLDCDHYGCALPVPDLEWEFSGEEGGTIYIVANEVALTVAEHRSSWDGHRSVSHTCRDDEHYDAVLTETLGFYLRTRYLISQPEDRS